MYQLNDKEIEKYWKDGFLYPIPLFSEQEAFNLRLRLEEIEKKYSNNKDLPYPINQYKRVNSQCVIPLAGEIALNENILDIVEKIIGPDILLWSVEFFIKEAKSKSIVSMHQDLTYWGLDDDQMQVTAWLALSLSDQNSGCMDFVKGSFKNPILPHNDTFEQNNLLSRGQEIELPIKDDEKTKIILNPGEISLHHGLTIHGSGPNVSNDRRIGVAIRYLNPEIKQIHAKKDYAILARGKDRYNNFIKYDSAKDLFSKNELKLYDTMRKYQAAALTRNSKKGIDLYQGNDGVDTPI
jgi:hypothetical protein